MLTSDSSKNATHGLLFLAFFFMPSDNIIFYYGFVSFFIFIVVGFYFFKNRNVMILMAAFGAFLLSGAMYRVVFYVSEFRIFFELIRLFFPLLVFLYLKKTNPKNETVVNYIFLWVFLDLVVSVLQFYHVRVSFIESLYYNESSLITLGLSSPRSLGFFPGVAEHGVFFMLLTVWSFTEAFINRKKCWKTVLVFFFSSICLLTSQSKSALVGAVIPIILVTIFAGGVYARSLIVVASTAIIFNIELLFQKFYQFKKLITVGLESSSFLVRQSKWEDFIQPLLDDMVLLFLGAGRAQTAHYGSTYDSDYVYILSTYGVVTLIITYILLGFFSIRNTKFSSHERNLSPLVLYLSIVVSGVAVTPLLNPTSQMLFVILMWSSAYARYITK